MLRKVKKMEKNRSIPWHFTLSDDDYTTTSEENNSSECIWHAQQISHMSTDYYHLYFNTHFFTCLLYLTFSFININ